MSTETKWKVPLSSKKNNDKVTENFEVDEILNKIKKIRDKRKKINNPKCIPTFDDLYETGSKTSSTLKDNIIPSNGVFTENFSSIRESMTNNSDTSGNNVQDASSCGLPKFSLGSIANDLISAESQINDEINKLSDMASTLNTNNADYYKKGLDDMVGGIGSIGSNAAKEAAAQAKELAGIFKELDFASIIKSLKLSFTLIGSILKTLFRQLIAKLKLFFNYIKLFLLNWKNWYDKITSRIAYALTNNHATGFEISTFRVEINKFVTILLVWFFLYNWYFVVFFLEKKERYDFSFTDPDPDPEKGETFYKKFMNIPLSKILYAIIGPGLRVVEFANWILIDKASELKQIFSKKLIFVVMAFFFVYLVSTNWHMSLIVDFFNSLDFKFGSSVTVLITIAIIGYYAFGFLFSDAPWLIMPVAGLAGIAMALAIFIISVLYILLAVGIGIPIGVVLVTLFLVLHSFFGIMIYNGFNYFSTITAIGEDLASGLIKTYSDDCLSTAEFKFTKIPVYIYNFFVKMLNYGYLYIFEIAVLLILFDGITTYTRNFGQVLIEKTKINKMADMSSTITSAFQNLFTWTILINLLVMVLIIIFMIKKYIRLTYFNDSDNKEARDKMLKKVHGEDKFLEKQAINTGAFVNKVANKGSNYVNDKTNKVNNFVGDKMKSVTQIFEPKPTAGISDYIEKQVNNTT
jgi:hypothetical protein